MNKLIVAIMLATSSLTTPPSNAQSSDASSGKNPTSAFEDSVNPSVKSFKFNPANGNPRFFLDRHSETYWNALIPAVQAVVEAVGVKRVWLEGVEADSDERRLRSTLDQLVPKNEQVNAA